MAVVTWRISIMLADGFIGQVPLVSASKNLLPESSDELSLSLVPLDRKLELRSFRFTGGSPAEWGRSTVLPPLDITSTFTHDPP